MKEGWSSYFNAGLFTGVFMSILMFNGLNYKTGMIGIAILCVYGVLELIFKLVREDKLKGEQIK
jgi:hypothetical protein